MLDPQLDPNFKAAPTLHSPTLHSPILHSREDWVAACEFHNLSHSEVLEEVIERASRISQNSQNFKDTRAIVLLDLDSTLYEVGPRTHAILREWANSPMAAAYPEVQLAFQQMEHKKVGYSIRDTFFNLNLITNRFEITPHSSAFEEVRKFWSDRFFKSSYLLHDQPYQGAVEFVQKLHQQGTQIVYLTGRDEPNMGEGTRANLLRDGFPWDVERTRLLMKPAAHLNDLDFKKQAALQVNSEGKLIASFENEPPNVAALQELLPEVMHVFVDTVYSDHLTRPSRGLYRIPGFI